MSRFARFAWGVLAYNVLVVLWGACVRATGSGAGCGSHWPTCDGSVVPRPKTTEMMIEYSHRVTSGIALLAVVALGIAAFVAYPKKSPVRRAAVLSVVFMIGEAAIGAGLVLFELVAHDKSMKRALSMALHLNNTFLLLAALTATAHFASGGARLKLRGQGALVWPIVVPVFGVMVLATTGAVTALGDTLFPASSLAAGVAQDLDAGAHLFVRLRALHPFLAVGVGLMVTVSAAVVRHIRKGDARVAILSRALAGLFVAQLAVGVVNLLLRAPIATQVAHLLLADILWIVLVSMGLEAFGKAPEASKREAVVGALTP